MKLIGITMRRDNNNKWKEKRDSLSEDWLKFLSKNFQDYNFILIPNIPNKAIKLAENAGLDGLILSNGNDWGSCQERDQTELNLIEWCINLKKPILGVCRGFQVLNKYFGGKINKDVHKLTNFSHAGSIHKIKILNQNIYHNNFTNEFLVNSFHNQGVFEMDLGKDLIPFAKSDNLIEGFFHKNEPILGIQWHPEREITNEQFDLNLFRRLFENNLNLRTFKK